MVRPTTEFYTLPLHDALPISLRAPGEAEARGAGRLRGGDRAAGDAAARPRVPAGAARSEEHTSELQSRQYLVCRLLLEKKMTTKNHQDLNRQKHSLLQELDNA